VVEDRKKRLIELLRDPDPEIRKAAAESLNIVESFSSLDKILEVLQGGERGAKVNAIFALERIDSDKVFPPLLQLLQQADADLRATAIQVLGTKKNPQTLGVLVKHLKDPHPAVRVHAATAVGHFSDKRLIPYLAVLSKEKDDTLAAAATKSLGQIGAVECETPILAAMQDPRPAVRLAATRAISTIAI
jgi:HEAT repeat protein